MGRQTVGSLLELVISLKSFEGFPGALQTCQWKEFSTLKTHQNSRQEFHGKQQVE